jgi:hypothetical protein
MKKTSILIIGVMCLSFKVRAQSFIVSSDPPNLAAAVAADKSVTLTFNAQLDTSQHLGMDGWPVVISKIDPADSLKIFNVTFGSNLQSITFELNQRANTDYVWLIGQAAFIGGGNLSRPFALNYTTAAAYGSLMVSGHVFSAKTDPANAFVGLFDRSLLAPSGPMPDRMMAGLEKVSRQLQDDGGPMARLVTTVDDPTGAYRLDLVREGVYWPIAAKDMNGDGQMDPMQDLMGFYDPDHNGVPDSLLVLGGASLNIDIELINLSMPMSEPVTARARLDTAIATAKRLTPDQELKAIMVHQDTPGIDGRSNTWAYIFYSPVHKYGTVVFTGSNFVVADSSKAHVPPLPMEQMKSIPHDFVDSDVAMAALQANGGASFHSQHPDAMRRLSGGNEFWAYPPDPTRIFWLAEYIARKPDNSEAALHVFVDMITGAVITSGYSGIADKFIESTPSCFLMQNYPNPFNARTRIEYLMSKQEHISIRIYDLKGRAVASLVDGDVDAGRHSMIFDASGLACGIYVVRFETRTTTELRKMLFLK